MKRELLIPVTAFAALMLLTVSCKKKNPTDPVNKTTESCRACLSESFELEYIYSSPGVIVDTVLVSTSYAQAAPFWLYGQNMGIGNFGGITPTGIRGVFNEGTSIAFNTSGLMECPANKLTFVHARTDYGIANYPPALLNVQLPGTPVICTTADSLAYYLSPYGYTVEKHHQPGTVWFSSDPTNTASGEVDSMIIRGPGFDNFIVGANMIESELRSICVEHE